MFNRKLFASSCFTVSMALAAPSFAGSVSSSTINNVLVNASGTAFVRFAKTLSGRPACATLGSELTFDSTSAGGRAVLAAVTAAKLSGRAVNASGTNTCTGTRENLASVTLL